MRNEDLIRNFVVGGYTHGHGSNLYIDGDKLINFNTTICQRVNGDYILNGTHYSRTTTKLQNYLKKYCSHFLKTVTDIDYNTKELI